METIYNILEKILPFSWVSYDFMKNAFIAIILITPLLGMVGTLNMFRKKWHSFCALDTQALTGIAIGVVLGVL